MKESSSNSFSFDDSSLPVNNLSVERMEEMEKLIVPKMKEAIDKLRQEQPHLFKSPSSIK